MENFLTTARTSTLDMRTLHSIGLILLAQVEYSRCQRHDTRLPLQNECAASTKPSEINSSATRRPMPVPAEPHQAQFGAAARVTHSSPKSLSAQFTRGREQFRMAGRSAFGDDRSRHLRPARPWPGR